MLRETPQAVFNTALVSFPVRAKCGYMHIPACVQQRNHLLVYWRHTRTVMLQMHDCCVVF